jgi:hypothetical protein
MGNKKMTRQEFDQWINKYAQEKAQQMGMSVLKAKAIILRGMKQKAKNQ